MTMNRLCALLALVLALVSFLVPTYPLLSIAVILLALALLV